MSNRLPVLRSDHPRGLVPLETFQERQHISRKTTYGDQEPGRDTGHKWWALGGVALLLAATGYVVVENTDRPSSDQKQQTAQANVSESSNGVKSNEKKYTRSPESYTWKEFCVAIANLHVGQSLVPTTWETSIKSFEDKDDMPVVITADSPIGICLKSENITAIQRDTEARKRSGLATYTYDLSKFSLLLPPENIHTDVALVSDDDLLAELQKNDPTMQMVDVQSIKAQINENSVLTDQLGYYSVVEATMRHQYGLLQIGDEIVDKYLEQKAIEQGINPEKILIVSADDVSDIHMDPPPPPPSETDKFTYYGNEANLDITITNLPGEDIQELTP